MCVWGGGGGGVGGCVCVGGCGHVCVCCEYATTHLTCDFVFVCACT